MPSWSKAIESHIQEYDRLFGEGGTANAQLSIARINYEQAVQSYENAQDYYKGYALAATLRGKGDAGAANINECGGGAADHCPRNNSSDITRAYCEESTCSRQLKLWARVAPTQILTVLCGSFTAASDHDRRSGRKDGAGPSDRAPETGFCGTCWRIGGIRHGEASRWRVIYDERRMLIQVSLLAEDALALKAGGYCGVHPADGTSFEAAVDFISPWRTMWVSTVGLTENRCTVELSAGNLPPRSDRV